MASVAYATDDSASDDSTAKPVILERRSCWAAEEGSGRPRRSRLTGLNTNSVWNWCRSEANVWGIYDTDLCDVLVPCLRAFPSLVDGFDRIRALPIPGLYG